MDEQKFRTILLIEDSNEDYYATKRAFEKSGVANQLYRCADGIEALDYLYRRDKYADPLTSPRPNVILLDLNLPKKDGRDVLKTVKSDPDLQIIPIIVLTTSLDERDINYCYQMGANSYIQKPVDLNRFIEAIRRLKDYWFEIVILPRGK
ncbi:two-component response regulator [Legionella lansingensis]|uniref:Two-component response regulator n=1 Tax=Legionella lansingensis TaxID=45067 RepID=A0A0W0W1E0_9GAMM|nr:response regulator [Legionella lansingensis]KTD26111.1 two-component response regulator [Legionella lansingensis]SNV52607.1 two-component response regulator [Legionella lansingensis]